MTQSCQFTVYGDPKPQGSKRALMPKNARFPVVVESAGQPLKHWRTAISQVAAQHATSVFTEPVEVRIEFHIARPKSHFGTGRNASKLKDAAPRQHTQKPDTDKLIRAVLDSLSKIVYRDDSQVVALVATKHWTDGKPRADIHISEAGEVNLTSE